MLCPNCKTEHPDGTLRCSNCGANFLAQPQQPIVSPEGKSVKQKKPVTKKWWFWVIIVLAAIVLIGTIGGGNKTEDDTTPSAVPTTKASDVVNADSNNNATTTKTEEKTTKNTSNRFKLGDTVNDNGFKITFVSAEEWTDYDNYAAPSEGKKIIRIKIDVVNDSKADVYISSYSFDCYVDNQPAENYIWADDEFSTVNLSAGRTNSGYLYYEVPADADKAEIEYETNYFTDKKAIVEITF